MDADFDKILGSFVERLKGAGDLDRLRAVFEDTVNQLGFRYFTGLSGFSGDVPRFVELGGTSVAG